MGGIWSRWRKKPSTIEVLEKLEKEIESLEKLRRSNLESQKRIIGRLLLFSVLLYILTACVFYFYYFPESIEERLLYLAPVIAFGFVVWLVKKFLHWYFVKRISKNESALEECKEKKKQILEDVMEKETYKKAKEILEKFDPHRYEKLESTESTPAPQRVPQGQELRQRPTGQKDPSTPQKMPIKDSASAQQTPTKLAQPTRNPQYTRSPYGPPPGTLPPGPPMPRPVLPREKSISERLIDVLVGDGVQNRYALVCKQCASHNGMALKEEFEFISFRCCYCYTMNPARKNKPHAPKLDFSPPTPRRDLLPTKVTKPEGASGSNDGKESASSESDHDETVTRLARQQQRQSEVTHSKLTQNVGVEEIKKDQ